MEDIVSFELAKKLKEKGYPQRTFGNYDMIGSTYVEGGRYYKDGCICNKNNAYTAPQIHQVLKWLREEKNLHFEVVSAAYGYNLIISDTPEKGGTDRYFSHINYDGTNYGGAWDRYEDCVLAGIEYTLDDLI